MAANAPSPFLIALQRFGYGASPDGEERAGDARALLHAELARNEAGLIAADVVGTAGLQGTSTNHQAVFAAAEARKTLQLAEVTGAAANADPAGRSEAGAEASPSRLAALRFAGGAAERILRAEALIRFRRAIDAPVGLVERLVAFWSNHFCVSVAKGEVARATAGSFEREAIRPHVLGRFADMLLAVERHPAMLFYLDNAQSIGPDARANAHGTRGLNENLAREILELHTLGVSGGYTQADVTSLARVLTGWTFAGHDGRLGEPGTFVFNAATHQPAGALLMGRSYPAGGFGQGEAVLNDLASHPATARHVATKLVRHFIADEPPPSAVERIASVFSKSDGNLRAVSLALIDLPAAWSTPPSKIRDPYQYLVAAHRLLSIPMVDPGQMIGMLRTLGMPLWEPPGPNGFPDTAAAWASPEGLKLRLDVSAQLAQRVRSGPSPLALLDQAYGPALSDVTRNGVAGAESGQQAVALALMAPEFQRR